MTAQPRDAASRRPDRAAAAARALGEFADEIHAAVAQRLGNDDIRYTRTRRAVVDILVKARAPLTVDQIRARTSVPVSSVYRTITTLEETGLVHRLTNSNSEYARFELAEDLLGHHHHLACARCGTMTDVTLPDSLEADLDRVLKLLAKKQHFALDGHRLDIVGTCADCSTTAVRADHNPGS